MPQIENLIKNITVNNVNYKIDYTSLANLPTLTSISLASNAWVGENSPYSQAITISGITNNNKIDLQPDATVLSQMNTDGTTALYVVNNNSTLTAYAIDAKPTSTITVQAIINTVNGGE